MFFPFNLIPVRYIILLTLLWAFLLTVPDKIFQGVCYLTERLFFCLSKPINWIRATCCSPVYRCCCGPGGCIFNVKECCVGCEDACYRRCCCCCPHSQIDKGKYNFFCTFFAKLTIILRGLWN